MGEAINTELLAKKQYTILIVGVTLILYCAYALIMIWDSSVYVDGKRWFCLLDDPMISMRYARNFVNGMGLVWNEHEYIEGITNLGWTLIMGLFHTLTNDHIKISGVVQLFGVICNVVTVVLVAKLAWLNSKGSRYITVGSAALTAFYYPSNYWGVYGMETSMLACLITLATYRFLKESSKCRFPISCYVIMGIATIVRLDAAVVICAFGAYGLFINKGFGRLHHLIAAGLTLVGFLGLQTLWRFYYYGELFPNTYYLKMTGFPIEGRIARGAYVTFKTLYCQIKPVLFLLIILAFVKGLISLICSARNFGIPRSFWSSGIVLLLVICISQYIYSIYVGGDAWEQIIYCNRYIVVVFPLFSVVWWHIIRKVGKSFGFDKVMHNPIVKILAPPLVAYLAIYAINGNSTHPDLQRQIYLFEKPLIYHDSRKAILALQKLPFDKKAVVCSDWAGAIPYFYSGYVVDPLGKCNSHIAKLIVPEDNWASQIWYRAFYPGHMKWDPDYIWTVYRPDYMVFRWPVARRVHDSILEKYYILIPDNDGNEHVWKLR